MTALFRADRMRAGFDALKPGDIASARAELNTLIAGVRPLVSSHADRIFGVKVDTLLGAMLSHALDDVPPALVLVWLPLRTHALFPVIFHTFVALLSRPPDEWLNADLATVLLPQAPT